MKTPFVAFVVLKARAVKKLLLRSLFFQLLVIAWMVASGCVGFQVGVEPGTGGATQPSDTGLPEAAATSKPSTPSEPALQTPPTGPAVDGSPEIPAAGWVEYWDERYGYGLALPCWWSVSPTPSEGMFATLTVRSYDEAFAQANSIKGGWIGGEWPEGAVKMDFTLYEGADPSQDLEAAARQVFETLGNVVDFVDQRPLGHHPALLVGIHNPDAIGDSSAIYVVRLSPDKLLLINTIPQGEVASKDVKGILNSLAVSRAEKLAYPSYPPAEPLIPTPEACGR